MSLLEQLKQKTNFKPNAWFKLVHKESSNVSYIQAEVKEDDIVLDTISHYKKDFHLSQVTQDEYNKLVTLSVKDLLPSNLYSAGFSNSSNPDKYRTEQLNLEMVEDLRPFIRDNFQKQKTINVTRSSYGLKHIVERCINKYVCNGEFIAAMILEGFNYKAGSINANFNISNKSIKATVNKFITG
jgi:hypothetical protein